jgi:2-methylcitrate synthase
VALSGVVAGNTAVCTVGRTGNDLHYRGYDIQGLALHATFEEVAFLLIHGDLPAQADLKDYIRKLKSLRGIPLNLREELERIPAAAHPMDVLRTACSVLGCVLPEKDDRNIQGTRDIIDRLIASFGSILLYWWHYSQKGVRIDVETDDDTVAGHLLHLLHGRKPSKLHERCLDQSLILYAEHDFAASTFAARVIAGTLSDIYSAITGAIGTLRGPKHGGANEAAYEIQRRYRTPDEAEEDIRVRVANKEIIIGFGHPVYTVSDPRNPIIKEIARTLCSDGAT